MAKTDRAKEGIGWLKVIFGLLVATDISLLAWLAENFNNSDRFQVFIGLAAVAVVTAAVAWVNRTGAVRLCPRLSAAQQKSGGV